jgi:hypothetical protein
MKLSHVAAVGFVALTLSIGPASAQQSNAPVGALLPPVSPMGGGGSNLGSAQLFAVVNANGAAARGKGQGAVSRIGVGVYRVGFLRNVTLCGYVASVGGVGLEVATGIANVSRVAEQTNVLVVRTFSLAGVAANRPFHIYVDC